MSKPRLQRIHAIYIGVLIADKPHRLSLTLKVARTSTRNGFLREGRQV